MSANAMYDIKIKLVVTAPFIVQGSEPGAFGIDAVVERDFDGRPCVPGTLLIGKLREAWAKFEPALNAIWLGEEGSSFQPSRGRLVDSDLHIESWRADDDAFYPPYPRVAIDEITGAAKEGALQFIEQPWKIGQKLTFVGSWAAIASANEIAHLAKSIAAGLRWIGQIGAEASVGFGQIESVEVTSEVTKSIPAAVTSGDRIYYSLKSDAALMFPAHGSGSDNLFVSSDEIPGNVIKAALALTISAKANAFGSALDEKTGGALGQQYENLVFSHALPTSIHNARPAALCASFVEAGGQFFDASSLAKPHLIDGEAPAFPIDWKTKHYKAVDRKSQRGWEIPNRKLRVRTAISDGVAAEGKLFGAELMETPANGWAGWIDLSHVADSAMREAIRNELSVILANPILFLGKTKAKATLTIESGQHQIWASTPLAAAAIGDEIKIMLNTSALMTAVDCAGADIAAAYLAYWEAASEGAFALSHFFASQYLVGGEYAYQSRQKTQNPARPYRPWLLTRAGSIFVLKVIDKQRAVALLAKWCEVNLPLTEATNDCYGAGWKANPFQPQNGYGEILVNPAHGIPSPPSNSLSAITEVLI